MGDDLSLNERLSVRTPMQWSAAPNGGFSTGATLLRPVISGGEYGYQRVNVASELRDSTSLLNWLTRLIRVRKSCPEIGWSSWRFLPTNAPNTMAIRYDWQGRSLVMVHNFSPQPQQARLPANGTLQSVLDNSVNSPTTDSTHTLMMPGYGYNWYRLKR